MQRLVIFGCGYVGQRLAGRVSGRAATEVIALGRSAAGNGRLRALGVTPLTADLDQGERPSELSLAGATVFYFVPPPAAGEQDTRMARFTDWLEAGELPRGIVYLSTTGVYGDCGGAWVDETAPLQPRAARARRRVDAEQRILAWGRARGVAVVVLRVPGIYGPGRLPRARLERGDPVLRPELAPFSNRIHVDDLVSACLAAAEKGRPGAVYNVADDEPMNMSEYFNRVADALGLPRPPVIDLDTARQVMSPAMLAYQRESRRIDNRRMKEELGVELARPDLRSGLRASLDAGA